MTADPFARHDAAYVLGALSPADRGVFEEHLGGCARCRTAVSDLAGLLGLLARTDLSRLDGAPAGPPVPETLLPGLLVAVRRERRLRGRRTVAAAALAAAVSVGATALFWDDGPERPGAQPPAAVEMVALSALGEAGLHASVGLESVPWGTRVTLTCRYPDGTADAYADEGAATYVLVVRANDGSEEPVATWVGLPGAAMTVTGATAWRADDIVDVEVRTSAGRPLLRLNG